MLAINFQRFKKLREPSIVERATEILAPLRGEETPVLLRLEALRMVDETGSKLRYTGRRRSSSRLRGAIPWSRTHRRARLVSGLWKTRSIAIGRFAGSALEQVMGFLEMACG